jgi:Rps23 Pro-64 3,4-dihydroxylase Tpa1-like proline 4-hydroxylase
MAIINFDEFERNIKESQSIFNKEPFNYIVLDDFLNIQDAEKILEEFPKISSEWKDARGLHTQNKWALPIFKEGVAAKFMEEIHSKRFMDSLSRLTSIDGLEPDSNLQGAGYHQMTNGGFLDVHVDFNRLEDNSVMDRRLNLLVYFNKNWKKENNGYLELWDMEKEIMIENICPKFNRCVIFETNEVSFHGHPKPLNIGLEDTRKSLSVYFYTQGRSDIDYIKTHNTIYVNTESTSGMIKVFFNGIKHAFRKITNKFL